MSSASLTVARSSLIACATVRMSLTLGPARPFARLLELGLRRKDLAQVVLLAQRLDARVLRRRPRDVIKEAIDELDGRRVDERRFAAVDEPLQLPIDLADQALQRDAGLEAAGTNGHQNRRHHGPELLDLLARCRALEVRADAQQLVEIARRLGAFDPTEQRGLECRPETLRDFVEAAADIRAGAPGAGAAQVPLERTAVQQDERALGQRRLVARLTQVVQERQQRQRDVLAAAEQPLEIRRQLHHRTRQSLDALLGRFLVRRLREPAARLLHLLGEQRRAVNLDDLQRAARRVQMLGRARQRVRSGPAVDVVLDLRTRRIERARKLLVDELERVRRQIVHRVSRHTASLSRTGDGARRLCAAAGPAAARHLLGALEARGDARGAQHAGAAALIRQA